MRLPFPPFSPHRARLNARLNVGVAPLVASAFAVALFTTLGACSTPDAASSPYGLWSGKLIADDGNCPVDTESLLRIRGNTVIFNPGTGAQVLHGTFKESVPHYRAELVEKGMNGQPYKLSFDGYPVGMGIGGTYLTPRCRAHVTLVRK